MEAFSLLKFWRITAAESALDFPPDDADLFVVGKESDVTDDDNDEQQQEEDSFFDLEIGVVAGVGGKETEFPKQSADSVKQSPKPLSPTSLLRSPPKFPVFMLFKKSKCREEKEINNPQQHPLKSEDEEVRISSILQGIESPKRKYQKQNSISKKLGKDMVTKYAKLIKPLYIKVSRRYGETVKISDEKTASAPPPVSLCSPRKSADDKQSPGPAAGFRVVCKHLRKSLNGSSSVGMIPVPIPARRDDRLMEQHDGIQGAILHCKRSYNSSSSSASAAADAEYCMISESNRGYSWKKTVLEEKRFSI